MAVGSQAILLILLLAQKDFMWFNQKFFKFATATILALIIIWLSYTLLPILRPLWDFFLSLMYPIISAGFLYYLLRPSVKLLVRYKMSTPLAISLVYFFILIVLVLLGTYIYPVLAKQLDELAQTPVQQIEAVKQKTVSIINFFNFNMYSPQEINNFITYFLKNSYSLMVNNILDTVSRATQIVITLILTPIILFYFLRDDSFFTSKLEKILPDPYSEELLKLLKEMDTTLSNVITGQSLVALILGSIIFIGYLAIGLQHALFLAIFAMIFDTIPIVGVFLSLIPALMIAFSTSTFMVFKVIIVTLIAHLLEANLISPQIMGPRLHIHPLTIILLLLACGSMYGILGLFLATPLYALFKIIVFRVRNILTKIPDLQ